MSFVAPLVDYLRIVVFELEFVVSGGLAVAGEEKNVGKEKMVGILERIR